MKKINWMNVFAIVGLTLLSACSSSTGPVSTTVSTAAQLFSLQPTQDRATLQQTAQGYLATLLADPANAEVTFIKMDPAVVSKQMQVLAVTLPDGKTAQFHLREYNTITPGIEGWVGYKPSAWKQTHASSASEIDSDPFFYLSLARSGENIVGSVVVEGQTYRVQTLSPGQYVLIKIDESKLPPDGAPVQSAKVVASDLPTATTSHAASSVIRLLFVTTNQVRAQRPLNRLELAIALNDANSLMASSGVAIRFELAGIYDADYNQPSDYWQQAVDLMSNQQVMQQRDALRADMVSIYSTNPGLCGQARLTAKKSDAFSIISCPSALGHELGHNLGAMHHHSEPANVPDYAYGYKDEVGKFHTQMTTPFGAVHYFSNPRLSYQGRPLGDVDFSDVARRFNERRETVAAFYPDPQPKLILTLRGQNRSCTIDLSLGANVQLSWYLQCKDPQPFNPESAVVSGLYGANTQRKLCFANTLYTTNSCYSGFHNGSEFTIKNIHQGTGRPNTLEFSRRLMGAVTRITYD